MILFTQKHVLIQISLFLGLNFFLAFGLGAQCNNVTSGGSISGNQTIPVGAVPSNLAGISDATGGVGPAEYLWMFTTSAGSFSSATWASIPGSGSADYQPGALSQTTYFIRCARNSGCTEYTRESNIITVIVSGALPVELVDFSGHTKGHTVELNWATASEQNHEGFELQHSTDRENFISIAVLNNETGDSEYRKEYSYTDKEATPGLNYYRLLQKDIDGKTTYSAVIAVELSLENEIEITPNPIFDLMTVKVSELPGHSAVLTFVHLSTGQIVRQELLSDLQSNYRFNTTGLNAGIYLIQVLSDRGEPIYTAKFIKAGR